MLNRGKGQTRKGVGGFYTSVTCSKVSPDIKLLKATSAKEGKLLEKIVTEEVEDSMKNLNNDVLAGSQLQQAVDNETIKVETLKRKAEPITPKRLKVKISSMNQFKSNYFD